MNNQPTYCAAIYIEGVSVSMVVCTSSNGEVLNADAIVDIIDAHIGDGHRLPKDLTKRLNAIPAAITEQLGYESVLVNADDCLTIIPGDSPIREDF